MPCADRLNWLRTKVAAGANVTLLCRANVATGTEKFTFKVFLDHVGRHPGPSRPHVGMYR